MRRRSSNDKPQTWRIGARWNCFKSPTPIRIRLVPAKVQFEDLLSSNSCHWFCPVYVSQLNRQFLWEKTVFWKTVPALLGLYTTIGSSFREDLLLQTSFLFWFTFLILIVFEGAPCMSSCLLWELLRQNLCGKCCMSASSGFNFHVCHTSFI